MADMQNIPHKDLLSKIDAFLAETGMGITYFGKSATGNSEIVSRLRSGGRVWPETEDKVLSFMREYRAKKSAPQTEAAE